MRIDDIKVLFQYNYWANKRILAQAQHLNHEVLYQDRGYSWQSLAGTLVHIMDAEYGWRSLLDENTFITEMRASEFTDLDAIVARWEQEEAAMWLYLDRLSDEDMTGSISYPVEDGTRQRVLWHCLLHVVNHGTQHRSECAVMLTDLGYSPGEIDFTVFTLDAGI